MRLKLNSYDIVSIDDGKGIAIYNGDLLCGVIDELQLLILVRDNLVSASKPQKNSEGKQ